MRNFVVDFRKTSPFRTTKYCRAFLQEPPQSSPPHAPVADNSHVHYPRSIIRRPLFQCGPITSNFDRSGKDLHNEHFYNIPAFAALLELRDSVGLLPGTLYDSTSVLL